LAAPAESQPLMKAPQDHILVPRNCRKVAMQTGGGIATGAHGTGGPMAVSNTYKSLPGSLPTLTSLNAYSFMSMATMVSGFRRGFRISVRHWFFYIVSMVGVSALLALTGPHSFLREFEAFILCYSRYSRRGARSI
jgi:hypothetical protein